MSYSSGGGLKSKMKRKRTNGTKRWTPEEDRKVCEKLRQTIRSGGIIEQPSARLYYLKMASDLNLKDVSHIKLKAKVANLKSTYLKMLSWRASTAGQGLHASINGEQAVRDYIISKCPLFDILDEIFASRANNVNDNDDHLGVVERETGPVENFKEEEDEPGEVDDTYDDDDEDELNYEEYEEVLPNDVELRVWSLPPQPQVQAQPILKPRKILPKPSSSEDHTVDIPRQRMDVMEKKLEAEKEWRSKQYELEWQKLQLEKDKLNQSLEMKKLELEHQERIEKFRIEQEMKLQLEIAKLKYNSN